MWMELKTYCVNTALSLFHHRWDESLSTPVMCLDQLLQIRGKSFILL